MFTDVSEVVDPMSPKLLMDVPERLDLPIRVLFQELGPKNDVLKPEEIFHKNDSRRKFMRGIQKKHF